MSGLPWTPTLGAIPTALGTRFRVWAPGVAAVHVVGEGSGPSLALERDADGYFSGVSAGFGVGDRYRYAVEGRGPFPDPASRFQPEGVHGCSEVVDPSRFAWTDGDWKGVEPAHLVIYELHVGTFTAEGTFAAARSRLADLAKLGVTAVELMPVADFPGARGWGYDGVSLFAPARCYGGPEDLRRLVDEAHRLGLAVLLDVVYNHLGPDGNYLAQYSEDYFSKVHRSGWGPAIHLDGPGSRPVRDFLVENSLMWLHEFHLDGLRLDATHHLFDESPRHLLAELAAAVRESVSGRRVHLIAEDPRNLADLLRDEAVGGMGLDAIWSDDFHHEFRRYLVGDDEGVFRDFRGSLADLCLTINDGWLFRGAYSIHRGYHRGTDPSGIRPRQVVFTLQNHDRIGNRAFGERLNHQVDPATYRVATALLLTLPATPLLFQGQEWSATAPFLFFTDHEVALGEAIKEGRRREFGQYAAFADPARHAEIPDIQAESTFLACKLNWRERDEAFHAAVLRLYRAWLGLRRSEPALRVDQPGRHRAIALGADAVALRREAEGAPTLLLLALFKGEGRLELGDLLVEGGPWEVLRTTEDVEFAEDPAPPRVAADAAFVEFARPSAVLLRAVGSGRIAAVPGDQLETPRPGMR